MKSKIEIQILSPLTKDQLIFIRDEIRSQKGMEAFDLQLPPAPPSQGKMGDSLEMVILHSVIAGIAHFGADKIAHVLHPLIINSLKKYKEKNSVQLTESAHAMGVSGSEMEEKIEVIVSEETDSTHTITYIDEDGKEEIIDSREYSINSRQTHAVIVGISKYDDESNFSPIPPAEGNVTDLYKIFTTRLGLPMENIHRLDDETGVTILKKINEVSRRPGIETFILYYAGHGQKTVDDKLNLIARDTCTIDEKLHYAIAYADLERIIKSSPAAQKIIILDACHSGLAAQSGNANAFEFDSVYGTCVLASTSAKDSSFFKPNARNTYFTGYMLQLFNEGKKSIDKMLSINDIYNYTTEQLKKEPLNGPLPTIKYDIKNVDKSKFYIIPNKGFDLKALLNKPLELLEQGENKLNEAEVEFNRLEDAYPEETEWKTAYKQKRKEVLFTKLVREGDAYYGKKFYQKAKDKYLQAREIKNDYFINSKIKDCNKYTQTGGTLPPAEPNANDVSKKTEIAEDGKANKIKWIKYGIVTLIVIILALLIWKFWPAFYLQQSNDNAFPDTPASMLQRADSSNIKQDTILESTVDSFSNTSINSKLAEIIKTSALYEKEGKIVLAIAEQNKGLQIMNTDYRRSEIKRLKEKGKLMASQLVSNWVNSGLPENGCSTESMIFYTKIINACVDKPYNIFLGKRNKCQGIVRLN